MNIIHIFLSLIGLKICNSLIIETQSVNPATTPDTSHYPPNEPLVKVWLIRVTGTPQKILQTTRYYDLYYSPDLSKFVYANQVEEAKPAELHIANKDGSKDQILYTVTKENENYRDIYFYDWSPDSKSIMFDELYDEMVWMDLRNGSIENIPLHPGEPPEQTSLIWLDSSHLVAYRHTIDAFGSPYLEKNISGSPNCMTVILLIFILPMVSMYLLEMINQQINDNEKAW